MCLGFPCSQNTQDNTHCVDYLKTPRFMLFKKNDIQFLYFQFAKSISKTQAHEVRCYFCLCYRHNIMTTVYIHDILQGNYFSLQDKDFYEACLVYLGIVHGRWALRGVSSCEHCRLLWGSTMEEQVGFMERVLGEATVACRKPFLLNDYKFIDFLLTPLKLCSGPLCSKRSQFVITINFCSTLLFGCDSPVGHSPSLPLIQRYTSMLRFDSSLVAVLRAVYRCPYNVLSWANHLKGNKILWLYSTLGSPHIHHLTKNVYR